MSLKSLLFLNLDEFDCNTTSIESFDSTIFELSKWIDIIHNMPDIDNDINVLHSVSSLIDKAKFSINSIDSNISETIFYRLVVHPNIKSD